MQTFDQRRATFQTFKRENPNWQVTYQVCQRDSPIYQRIRCCWNEPGVGRHVYQPVLNVATGDIFNDLSRRYIFLIHLGLAVYVRPLHMLLKTAWHLSIIAPFFFEIFEWACGRRKNSHVCMQNMKDSMADIVRTPLYGLTLVAHHVIALVRALYAPNTLYQMRDQIGALERRLYRVETFHERKAWFATFCFSPAKNLIPRHQGDDPAPSLEMLAQRHVQNLRNSWGALKGVYKSSL